MIAAEARTWGRKAGDEFDSNFEDRVVNGVRNSMEKAGKEAKTAGGKAGEEAGKESGKKYAGHFATEVKRAIATTQRELKALKIPVDDADAKATVKELEAQLAALGKKKIGVNFDAHEAFDTLGEVENVLRDLQDSAATMDLRVNSAKAFTTIEKIRAGLQALNDVQIEVDVDINQRKLGAFENSMRRAIRSALDELGDLDPNIGDAGIRRIGELREQLETLGGANVGIDISAEDFRAEITRIRDELHEIATEQYTANVDIAFDTASAAARLTAQLEGIEKTLPKIHVDVDTEFPAGPALASVISDMDKYAEHADRVSRSNIDGANSFRAFNARVLGIAAIGPAVIPVVGALAAGLGALGPLALAAAGAIGVLGIGGSGISDVVSALNKLRDLQEVGASAERIKTATENLEIALSKVGPEAESFARYIFSLGPGFRELREGIQASLLPQLQEWMQTIGREYGPQFTRTILGMTDAVGAMFVIFARSLEGPAFHQLADMVERSGPTFIAMMATILANLGEGVASLVTAMEPLAFLFGGWLQDATRSFADWALGLSQTEGFADFLRWVERVGPKIGDFFVALADAIINLGVALAPYGETLLEIFTGFLRFIADADPETLGSIVQGIVGLTVAFQAIVGLNAAIQGFATVINIARNALAAFAGAQLAAGTTAASAIAGGIAVILGALVLLGTGLYLAYQNFDWFRDAVDTTWEAIKTGAEFVADLFTTYFLPVWRTVWAAISDFAQGVWDQVLWPILSTLGGILVSIWEGLQWAWEHIGWPILKLIGSVIATLWTIVGPILELLGTTLGYIWDVLSFAWENIGKPVFDAIISVINFLWYEVFEPIFGFIGGVLEDLIGWFQDLWDAVDEIIGWIGDRMDDLKGFFTDAATDIGETWRGMISSLYDAWTGEEGSGEKLFEEMGTALSTFKDQLGKPQEELGGQTFLDYFFDALSDAWDQITGLFSDVGDGIDGVTQDFSDANDQVTQVWEDMWGGIQEVWGEYGAPLFQVLYDLVTKAEQIVGTAFEAIRTKISDVWDELWTKFWSDEGPNETLKAYGKAVNGVTEDAIEDYESQRQAFEDSIYGMDDLWSDTGVQLIASFMRGWAGLRDFFSNLLSSMEQRFSDFIIWIQKPIRFVIDNIINGIFISGFNTLAKNIGSDARMTPIALPRGFGLTPGKGGGGSFAAGGFTGRGNRYDPAGIVHRGEYVFTAEETDEAGPDTLAGIAAYFRRRRRLGESGMLDAMAGYASGGYVAMGNLIKANFPSARITSAYRPGDPGYHGKGLAIDIAGSEPYPSPSGMAQMLQINRWLAANIGNITELIHTAAGAINLWHGAPHVYDLATRIQHMNHVHWAQAGDFVAKGVGVLGGGFLEMLTDPVGWLSDKINAGLGDFGSKSALNGILADVPAKILNMAKSVIESFIDTSFFSDPSVYSKPISGAGGNVALVQQLAAARGWTGREWDSLYALIMKESGFNNLAQNPTSTAYGMFQFLNSTWAGVGFSKTSDPKLQALAGFAYIADRYGSPSAALAFHNRNNWYDEGGYAEGELVVPDLHDEGGWLMPGLNVVMNKTGRPEPTINPATLDALQQIAANGSGQGGPFRDLVIPMVAGDPSEVMDEAIHQVKAYVGPGKYRDPLEGGD